MRRAVVLAVIHTVLAAPISGQPSSTIVTTAVPPAQVLGGTTTQTLRSGIPQSGRLIVKSNIPWVLRVSLRGRAPVFWRPAGAIDWLPVTSGAALRSGERGVHEVAYEIRADGAATVRFSLTPLP